MHGRLTGGAQCCLRGCENEAGSRKFDAPGLLQPELAPYAFDHERSGLKPQFPWH